MKTKIVFSGLHNFCTAFSSGFPFQINYLIDFPPVFHIYKRRKGHPGIEMKREERSSAWEPSNKEDTRCHWIIMINIWSKGQYSRSGREGSGRGIIVGSRSFRPPALVTPCVWTAMIAPLRKRQCTPLPGNYGPGKRMWNTTSVDSRHRTIQQPADGGDWEGSQLDGWTAKWLNSRASLTMNNWPDTEGISHEKKWVCVTQSPYKILFNVLSIYSPAEAVFVCRGVFLQQSSELQQGELLEQIHL